MFEGLALLINVLILVAGLRILNKASNWTITNSVKIAEITGFGKTTSDLATFSLITNLILWYFLSSEKLGWREGAVQLFIYFLSCSHSRGTKNIE